MQQVEPIVVEPEDEKQLEKDLLERYTSALQTYDTLNPIIKMNSDLQNIKRELDVVQTALCNPSDEDDTVSREKYDDLKKSFCNQMERLAIFQHALDALASVGSKLINSKQSEVNRPKVTDLAVPLISCFVLGLAYFQSQSKDEVSDQEKSDEQKVDPVE